MQIEAGIEHGADAGDFFERLDDGVELGIALALGTTRLLSNLLFEVTTTDALTFTIAASVFVAGGMPVTPPPHPTRYIGNRRIERLFYNCETADATRGHINDT